MVIEESSVKLDRIGEIISSRFIVKDKSRSKVANREVYEYIVVPRSLSRIDEDFRYVYREINKHGFYAQMLEYSDTYKLYVIKGEESSSQMTLTLSLLAITLVTVSVTAYLWYLSHIEFIKLVGMSDPIASAFGSFYVILIALSIIGPLALHEMGHYTASRLLGVPVSLPRFIPGIPGIGLGTFGAIIFMRFPPPNLNSLAIVAVSGPLAGFIAIIAVTLFGLSSSFYVEPEVIAGLSERIVTLDLAPLIFVAIANLYSPGDIQLILSPIAYSGYFLLLIHFLNLLPVGHLDGGQILRSITSPKTHSVVSLSVVMSFLVLSVFIQSTILTSIAIFLFIIYVLTGLRPHPGSAFTGSKPGLASYVSVFLWLFMLILTMPIPIT